MRFIVLITIYLAFLNFPCTLFAQDNWELQKSEQGVNVYTRNVPNSDYKEFKAEMTINSNINKIIYTLRDVNNFHQWMPESKSIQLLEQTDFEQYHYIETVLPWPAENRDMVYYNKVQHVSGNLAIISIEGIPHYLPEKKGVCRLSKVKGKWVLNQLSDNAIHITYQIHAEPNGYIPSWLVNSFMIETPFETMVGLRKMVSN